MPRKRKEEEAPKVIPELEALPPRRRKFVEAYTNPTSPTYSNATRSILAASPNITYGSARELGSRELAKIDTGNAIKAVLAACGASEGNLAALMWEYAQDRDYRVRTSAVRATEKLMQASGMLESESATAQIQMVLPQLSLGDIRAALASGRAESEGS